MTTDYEKFLKSKDTAFKPSGFVVDDATLSDKLMPFQKDIVKWALRLGRSACFADCGLGKTFMQLEWAGHVVKNGGCTNHRVLVVAPLAVAHQTNREGVKFGVSAAYSRGGPSSERITIANYDMFEAFNPADFTGIV